MVRDVSHHVCCRHNSLGVDANSISLTDIRQIDYWFSNFFSHDCLLGISNNKDLIKQ